MQSSIIRAQQVQKYYAQPSENRIQVIAPTNLPFAQDRSLRCWVPPVPASRCCYLCSPGYRPLPRGKSFWHEKPMWQADTNVSIVFQSFALFPWLTFHDNVEAPLRARGMKPDGLDPLRWSMGIASILLMLLGTQW